MVELSLKDLRIIADYPLGDGLYRFHALLERAERSFQAEDEDSGKKVQESTLDLLGGLVQSTAASHLDSQIEGFKIAMELLQLR